MKGQKCTALAHQIVPQFEKTRGSERSKADAPAINRYFLGIPCPAAGGLIASMVWVGTDINIQGTHISELVALVTVSVAFLMISNIKYRSFKEFDLKDNVPFVAIQIVVLIYLLIAWDPPKVLFCIFNCYTLLGIMIWLRNSILLLLLKLKTSIQNSTNN